MRTRELIKEGDARLKAYGDFLDTIDLLKQNRDDKKAVEFLLDMRRLDFEEKIRNTKSKLEQYKKEYVKEFEITSAECNSKMEYLVEASSKWIDKDPVGVTVKIKPLVDKYKDRGIWKGFTQEQKNDVYMELKGHYNFLTKVYNKNG